MVWVPVIRSAPRRQIRSFVAGMVGRGLSYVGRSSLGHLQRAQQYPLHLPGLGEISHQEFLRRKCQSL